MIVKFYLWKYRFCNSAGNACVPTNAKDPQPRKAVGDLLAEDEGFEFRYRCLLVARTPFLVSLSSDIFLKLFIKYHKKHMVSSA